MVQATYFEVVKNNEVCDKVNARTVYLNFTREDFLQQRYTI